MVYKGDSKSHLVLTAKVHSIKQRNEGKCKYPSAETSRIQWDIIQHKTEQFQPNLNVLQQEQSINVVIL